MTKYNLNYSITCQHKRSHGYPKADTLFNIYACSLDIGHEGEHGSGWGVWENDGPNPDILDLGSVPLYLVGGAVRDHLRGVKSNDWDFAVEAESFDQMRQWIVANDFEIFVESPKYFTIRARAPKDSFTFGGMDLTGSAFDFTLCRKERDYTDGRHPDHVEPGTLLDDLSRRDFTMNAVAIAEDGIYIDPFGGREDITNSEIRCVGSLQRLEEDGLRIMRALRFVVQLGFGLDPEIDAYLQTPEAVRALTYISEDRVRQELAKMLKEDSMSAIILLHKYFQIADHILNDRKIWLEPTTAKR